VFFRNLTVRSLRVDDEGLSCERGLIVSSAHGTFRWFLTVGAGWNVDNPVRPWPRLSKTVLRSGTSYWCLSLLGLFVGAALSQRKGEPVSQVSREV
jgi:hypothetical protein